MERARLPTRERKREREPGSLVRSVSTPETTVLLIGQNTLLTLVANDTHTLSKLLGDESPEPSLAQQGVNGLHFAPALLPSYLGKIGGHLVARLHLELDLNPMNSDLGWGVGGGRQ